MRTTPSTFGRRWASIPAILYILAAVVYAGLLVSGVKSYELGVFPDLFEVGGSFVVFFYAAFFVCWKWRARPALRIAVSVFSVFALFVLLAMLDVIGLEGPSIPGAHGMTVPNVLRWFWPGVQLELALENTAARFAHHPQLSESSISLRGAMPQPDGSLILCGKAGDFDSYSLVGRIDPQGNIDSGFKPVPIVKFVIDMRSQLNGTVLVEYPDPDGTRIDEVSPAGSRRPIAHVFFRGDLGKEQMNVELLTPVFPALLVRNYDKVTRINPDGKVDRAFNEEATKTIRNLNLGDVRRVAADPQGRIIVALSHALVRLDADAHLAPPGPAKYDPQRGNFDPNAIAIDPRDGAIYVTSGTEDPGGGALPWILRFDSNLHEDEAFSTAASKLGEGAGALRVLGFRGDGEVIVSLAHTGAGSRILVLNKSGELVRELLLRSRFIEPQSTAAH